MIIQIGWFTITAAISKDKLLKALYDWRLKKAIKKAIKLSRWHRRKYVVIQFGGWPRVYQRAMLKDLVKRRKVFKKGTTMEDIDKMTLYSADVCRS